VAQHKLDAETFATHRFELDRILDAYETFSNAAESKALKVVISR
jgi:alcohol dehydrogenase